MAWSALLCGGEARGIGFTTLPCMNSPPHNNNAREATLQVQFGTKLYRKLPANFSSCYLCTTVHSNALCCYTPVCVYSHVDCVHCAAIHSCPCSVTQIVCTVPLYIHVRVLSHRLCALCRYTSRSVLTYTDCVHYAAIRQCLCTRTWIVCIVLLYIHVRVLLHRLCALCRYTSMSVFCHIDCVHCTAIHPYLCSCT
jgi:hypothetical protein